MEATTCIVIEERPLTRHALASLVKAKGASVVAEVASSAEAEAAIRSHQPDLALLRLGQPRAAAPELMERISALGAATRVVLFVSDSPAMQVRELLALDAAAYLSDNLPSELFSHALQAAAHGKRFIDPSIATRMLYGEHDGLSARENEVLNLVCDGLSNKEIALRLGISLNTAKQHVSSIITKTGAHCRSGVVAAAFRRGLVT